jgi:hypothetical protein
VDAIQFTDGIDVMQVILGEGARGGDCTTNGVLPSDLMQNMIARRRL